MRFGHNFWLDGPIDLKTSRLDHILQDLFRWHPIWPNLIQNHDAVQTRRPVIGWSAAKTPRPPPLTPALRTPEQSLCEISDFFIQLILSPNFFFLQESHWTAPINELDATESFRLCHVLTSWRQRNFLPLNHSTIFYQNNIHVKMLHKARQ